MNGKTPHIVQYQGSKRILAPQIMQYMPKKFNRLVEPFAGMAAITIATAVERRTDTYWVNDLNEPLIELLRCAIDTPSDLIERYKEVWTQQFDYGDDHLTHYAIIREQFNAGERTPERMLYLLARCVKGAVRYGNDGKFNQSADKRRHGTRPDTLERNVYAISDLLRGRTTFTALDYREVFTRVKTGDIVYMDPPYQGVTNVRDNRYYAGVPFEEFVIALEELNRRHVDFLISYDGICGQKEYGQDLPSELGCKKVLLNAGLSSQAMLLGKKETTFEALYISKNLISFFTPNPEQLYMEELAYAQ